MQIRIPYGRGNMPCHVPDGTPVYCAPDPPRSADGAALVDAALAYPIASPPLRELAAGKQRALLIASDHTRPVPSRELVPRLLAELRRGNPGIEIVILIATGLHRAMTREELRAKFGDEILARETIECHDCRDESRLSDFGRLPSGGPLRLSSRIRWADIVVSEGFIEPHFFAGYSGGRKSILPGVASFDTVSFNHSAQMIASPAARAGCLPDNPIHRDMAFAAEKAALAFILNVILAPDKSIAGAFAGEPAAAHRAGCLAARERMRISPAGADVVVTSNGGYPLDQNLYQTVKCISTAARVVNPGGVIIAAAECADGIGGDGFYAMLRRASSPASLLEEISETPADATPPDQWQVQILCRALCRARVILVTEEKNRCYVEAMHMRWAGSIDDALRECEGTSVAVIPDGVGVIAD